MKIRPGCAQHIGSRNEQQDSFGFSHIEDAALVKRAGILAVVADGMGGLAMGKESGDLTVKAVLSVHDSSSAAQDPVAILRDAAETANRDVLSMAVKAGVAGDAGSTLIAVILKDANLYWTSVGDSRIYLYRAGELAQLNTEQNFFTDLMRRVADGDLSRDEALNHPDRASLTNFIGNPDLKPADSNLRPFPIQNGDWLVLCSDGLFGTLDDDDIREELYGSPNDACDRLVKKVIANNKMHQDNVTVAILGCGDKDPVTVTTRKIPAKDHIVTPLPKQSSIPMRLVVLVAVLIIIVLSAGGFYLLKWLGGMNRRPLPQGPAVLKIKDKPETNQKQQSSGKPNRPKQQVTPETQPAPPDANKQPPEKEK